MTDNIYERAEIAFDSPIPADALRGKFHELGVQLGCRVSFTQENLFYGGLDLDDGRTDKSLPVSVKMFGHFFGIVPWFEENRAIMMPFDCYRNPGREDHTAFDGLRYFVAPSYDVGEGCTCGTKSYGYDENLL